METARGASETNNKGLPGNGNLPQYIAVISEISQLYIVCKFHFPTAPCHDIFVMVLFILRRTI